jgi:hypothetical protein
MLRCVRELYVDANTHTRRDDTTLQKRIFPDAAASVAGGATVHVVVTFQPSRTDLIDWSDEAAQEKDVLLENVRDAVHSSQETPLMHSSSCLCVRVRGRAQFVEWGKGVCELLRKDGHWADLSDPCSGYPVRVSSLCRSLSLRSACMRVRVDMIEGHAKKERGRREGESVLSLTDFVLPLRSSESEAGWRTAIQAGSSCCFPTIASRCRLSLLHPSAMARSRLTRELLRPWWWWWWW